METIKKAAKATGEGIKKGAEATVDFTKEQTKKAITDIEKEKEKAKKNPKKRMAGVKVITWALFALLSYTVYQRTSYRHNINRLFEETVI